MNLKSKIGNYLLTLGLGLLIGLLIGVKGCNRLRYEPSFTKIESTKIEYKTDTIYVPKHEVVDGVAVAPKTPYRSIKLTPQSNPELHGNLLKDKKNFYRDTIDSKTDRVKLYYDITVEGILVDSVKLGFIDDRPQMIIKDTVRITKSISVDPKGLYITGALDSRLNPTIGASYLFKKNIVGISINPINKNTQIQFSRKLF